jgi:two-component system response regulator RpfG
MFATARHIKARPRLTGRTTEHAAGHYDRYLEGDQRPAIVMIVDDQTTGRKILERLIYTINPHLTVEAFADPFAALEHAENKTPDLVLTDYKMPAINGVEFTRRFRSIHGCGDVPVMVVTVVDDKRVRYQALEAGATDFLTRPIDHHECRARCRNLLTLRKQQVIIKDRASWLEHQVEMATKQIKIREQETLLRLAKAGEYRDEGTGNHILRMARYSRELAEEIGLTSQECDEIELAAPMHDIGKIGIPDRILLKRGRLTDQEFDLMKQHTRIGYGILSGSPSPYLQQGAVIALGHHEKYDGTGYPQGLKGEKIPLIARIASVADVYDALVSSRPYKRAWSQEEAVNYMRKEAGGQFDPLCVQAFVARQEVIRDIQHELSDTFVTVTE